MHVASTRLRWTIGRKIGAGFAAVVAVFLLAIGLALAFSNAAQSSFEHTQRWDLHTSHVYKVSAGVFLFFLISGILALSYLSEENVQRMRSQLVMRRWREFVPGQRKS